MKNDTGEIVIYQTENGKTKIQVIIREDTIWLNQNQLADLYQTSKSNVSEHIRNIINEEELDIDNVLKQIPTLANNGKTYDVNYYNLDMIISLGYRIKSKIATNFRIWATERLKEYMIKGFTLDDERLKQMGGANYWDELLDRIRDIRSSEKVMYRQVLDLYATSVDYNPRSKESTKFFKIVQNKLHYAAHGHTAAEIIYQRSNSNKPFMGLTNFSGGSPSKRDIGVAKNYLTSDELKILNNLVSGYFDFAEIQAMKRKPMYMQDYIDHLDLILSSTGEKILDNAGKVSQKQALAKAEEEYKKYKKLEVASVEKEYLKSVKALEKKAEERNK
ncbi:virulence RhuM family protein [Anaerococcus sp. Marseille-Q5996]|uniref:virulence RhuM family protein n=1 Tax=Anaerococcus sp. Marseille-Q5996 TaxID=2972769 RepID=UPI0021C9C232|nr:virulence RhuM family protein [Anaerococcus sp. Marseille-Q5996]